MLSAERDALRKEVDRLIHAPFALERRIAEAEKALTTSTADLADARRDHTEFAQQLADLDRPLRRRRNATEIDRLRRALHGAERRMNSAQRRLDVARTSLSGLRREQSQLDRDREQLPMLSERLHDVTCRLDDDDRRAGRGSRQRSKSPERSLGRGRTRSQGVGIEL